MATRERSRHLHKKSWQKLSNGGIHWATTRAARPHLPATNFTLANDEYFLSNHSQVRRNNNLNLIRGIPVQLSTIPKTRRPFQVLNLPEIACLNYFCQAVRTARLRNSMGVLTMRSLLSNDDRTCGASTSPNMQS